MRLRPGWLLLAVGVFAIMAVAVVRAAGRFLVVADPLPSRADAIVMLAGSPADRVLEAAHLARANVAPLVVLTRESLHRGEAALHAHGVRFPEDHEIARQALIALGVAPTAIRVLPRRAHSTVEADVIALGLPSRDRRLVVSVAQPTRRARLILAGAGTRWSCRCARRRRPRSRDHWWRPPRAIKDVLISTKLLVYWLVERWTIEPCGGANQTDTASFPTASRIIDELALGIRSRTICSRRRTCRRRELRDGRPARVRLDPVEFLTFRQDVDRLERHPDLVEDLDGGSGESTHREAWRPLHVDQDGILLHLPVDLVDHIAHRRPSFSDSVRSDSAWIRGMRSPRAA
jgi:hypothetical protein